MLLVRGVSVRTWPEVLVGKSKKTEIDARDAARGRDFNWLLTECVLFRSNDETCMGSRALVRQVGVPRWL